MTRAQGEPFLREISRVFREGPVANLSEGQLLERFVGRGDDLAFAALVALHGPMVAGVCRRRLRDSNDVDDAFQATFLVLVRRAGSLREGTLLGPWLHAVATRVAGRAGADLARRQRREAAEAAGLALAGVVPDYQTELREALDEEINGVPER